MTETDRPADHGADRPSHPAPDPGEGEAAGRWLPVGEAARTLGITRDAVWSRIKRRTLPYRRGPEGRAFVLIGTTVRPTTAPPDDHHDTDRPNDPPARKSELTALQVENEGLRARLADKDAEIARMAGIVEHRDREAERM